MKEFPVKLSNVSAAGWTVTYTSAGSDRTLALPAGNVVEVTASKVLVDTAWKDLTGAAIVTSDGGFAHLNGNTDEVISVISVAMGLIAAWMFWREATPLVR